MKAFTSRRLTHAMRATAVAVAIALPMVVSADQRDYSTGLNSQFWPGKNQNLLQVKVRKATEKYLDINAALNENPEHWVAATPCVSGPNEGAMGVHLIKPSRVGDGLFKGDEPEALIYEPLPNGSMRLVGVEFIVIAADWARVHPNGPAPSVDGHLANYVGEPNRYGLPAFFELHVWAWQNNPKGTFADWNTQVSCERQSGE